MPRNGDRQHTNHLSTSEKGARLERAAARSLKHMGYSVLTIRSAGSRGIDIVAIGPQGRLALCTAKVQGGIQPRELKVLRRLARRLPRSAHIFLARKGLNGAPLLEVLARGQAR